MTPATRLLDSITGELDKRSQFIPQAEVNRSAALTKGFAALSIIVTLVIIGTQISSMSLSQKTFTQIREVYLPLIEAKRQMTELHGRMSLILQLAVKNGTSSFANEYESLNKSYKLAQSQSEEIFLQNKSLLAGTSLPSRLAIDDFENEIILQLREGNIIEAQRLLDNLNYQNAQDRFSQSSFSSSKEINGRLNAVLLEQSHLYQKTGLISGIGFAMAVLFWLMVMRSYSLNIKYRKQMETLLEEEKIHTFQASRLSTLGEMAGGVAHEINNPLTIILGYAEILGQQLSKKNIDRAQLIRISAGIAQTTQRIASIVKSLRTYARDDSRSPFRSANLDSIIEGTLVLCQEKLKSQNVTIAYQPPATPIHLACREVQISQVLLNLIHNSLDAILDDKAPKWIQIEVENLVNLARIRVTDSGHGIPEDIQDKILQPFFTTKEIGKGTGLGLSISRSILLEHQGNLFYDRHHKNTSFVLEVPTTTFPLNEIIPTNKAN